VIIKFCELLLNNLLATELLLSFLLSNLLLGGLLNDDLLLVNLLSRILKQNNYIKAVKGKSRLLDIFKESGIWWNPINAES
jgi:hypothetical protein